MYKNKTVGVVIPTYNEAESIRGVIDGFFETGFVDEVVVIDNNALGNTREEVSKTKARIVHEPKQGYGFALMRGLLEVKSDLVVMVEADDTFRPVDIEKFLIYSFDFGAVFGTRTSRAAMWDGAFMPYSVRFGNWFWAKIIEVLFNGPVLTDVGCTYKLINRKLLEEVKKYFKYSRGDGTFSPELMIWLLKHNKKIIEIPVIYKKRVGQSGYTGSVWKAVKLGLKMLFVIIKYRFKKI